MKKILLSLYLAIAVPLIPYEARATVTACDGEDRYIGNGSTTAFAYSCKILSSADIKVLVDGILQTLTTHYTVSGVGASNGGTVTFVTAPANATAVTIIRTQPVSQLTNYIANEAYNPLRVMQDLDKITMVAQMLTERVQRVPILAEKSTYNSLSLPDPVASNFLQWKSDLSGFQNVTLANITGTGLAAGQIAHGAGVATPLIGVAAFSFGNNRLTINTPTPVYDLQSSGHSASQSIALGSVGTITTAKAVDGIHISGTLTTTTAGGESKSLNGLYFSLDDNDNGAGDHRVRGVIGRVGTTATAGSGNHKAAAIQGTAEALGSSDADLAGVTGEVITIATTPAGSAYSVLASQTGTAGKAIAFAAAAGSFLRGLDLATLATEISEAAIVLSSANGTRGKIRWNDAGDTWIRGGVTSGLFEINGSIQAIKSGAFFELGATPATTGHQRVANLFSIVKRNAANSADLVVIDGDGSNNLTLGNATGVTLLQGSEIKWGKALVALGGGAGATLGTIGGSGPATAGQNTWMRVQDSAGAAFWVPAWK